MSRVPETTFLQINGALVTSLWPIFQLTVRFKVGSTQLSLRITLLTGKYFPQYHLGPLESMILIFFISIALLLSIKWSLQSSHGLSDLSACLKKRVSGLPISIGNCNCFSA